MGVEESVGRREGERETLVPTKQNSFQAAMTFVWCVGSDVMCAFMYKGTEPATALS